MAPPPGPGEGHIIFCSIVGGFGAQLAWSESPSKSLILGWVWGPASWVGIPFEIVDFGVGLGPS